MTEIIIDDGQAQFTGTWQTSSFKPHFYGTGYHFANRSAASAEPRIATWRSTLSEPGDYTVAVWLPDGGSDRSASVKYRLHHAGQVSEFTVDHRQAGGVWRQLGTSPLPFAGDGEEYLELRLDDIPPSPDNAALYVHADAVRFGSLPTPLATGPTGLTANAARNHLELVWAPLEGADGYVVQRRIGTEPAAELGRPTTTAFLDLDLDLGTSCTYAVAGYNAFGIGPSVEIPGALAAGAPLQAVQGLVVTMDAGRPRLAWQPNRDAGWYVVQRAAVSGGPYSTVARVDGTEFTDAPLTEDAYYVIRSVNEHGACQLSSWQVNAFADAAPPSPAIDVVVASRCIGSKTTLGVSVANRDAVSIDVTIATIYGTKTLTAVNPAKNAFHAFSTRETVMRDGEVTVTATAVVDGTKRINTMVVRYDGRTCS